MRHYVTVAVEAFIGANVPVVLALIVSGFV